MKSAKQIMEEYHISAITLMNWRNTWKIKYKKITRKTFLYDDSEIIWETNIERKSVYYARVSTTKQSEDLKEQIKLLKKFMINDWVKTIDWYSEIVSWINEDRKELKNLLSEVKEWKIDKIYITYEDRLSRFGFWYLQYFCHLFNTKIIVIMNEETDSQNEIANDLISIIHHYSMKLYSNRRKKFNEIKWILWDIWQ